MVFCSYGLQHHLSVLEGNQSSGDVSLEERDFCVPVALNIGQPLAPSSNAVNKAEGVMPSCQLCYEVVALEEQSLSCYNFNSFSHQKACFETSPSKWMISA